MTLSKSRSTCRARLTARVTCGRTRTGPRLSGSAIMTSGIFAPTSRATTPDGNPTGKIVADDHYPLYRSFGHTDGRGVDTHLPPSRRDRAWWPSGGAMPERRRSFDVRQQLTVDPFELTALVPAPGYPGRHPAQDARARSLLVSHP